MSVHHDLASFVSGFTGASDTIRKENQHRQDQQDKDEQDALTALYNSPDAAPHIKAAAMTALLTKQPGKSSGLDKWFGKQAEHPAYGEVLRMLAAPPGQGARPTAASVRGTLLPATQMSGFGTMPEVGGEMDDRQVQVPEQQFNVTQAATRPQAAGVGGAGVGGGAVPAGEPPPQSPFLAPGTREGAVTYASNAGRMRAQKEGLDETYAEGYLNDDEYGDARREVATGHATPRAANQGVPKSGTVVVHDDTGKVIKSYVATQRGGKTYVQHPDYGEVEWSQLGEQGNAEWRPGGLATQAAVNPAAGAMTSTASAKEFQDTYGYLPPGMKPGDYVKFRVKDGKVIDAAPTMYTPPPFYESTSQTAEGLTGIPRGSRTAVPVPGGAPAATPPATNAASLGAALDRVNRAVGEQQGKLRGFLPVERVKAMQDAEARLAGFADYATLTRMAGDATRAVGGSVPPMAGEPPPDAPDAPGVPASGAGAAGGGRGAAPAGVAGQPRRAAPTPGKKPAKVAAGIDDTTQRVLSLLGR